MIRSSVGTKYFGGRPVRGDVTESLAPGLQIIVMEHANLPDQRFQDALVEDPGRASGL